LKVLYELFGKGEKICYFCQDEIRLGLKTIPGKRITVKGVKPLGCTQWPRKKFYLYGAIEVQTAESYFYEFSHLDSQCFQRFINQLSEEFSDIVIMNKTGTLRCTIISNDIIKRSFIENWYQ
jgi:hypothetical protein